MLKIVEMEKLSKVEDGGGKRRQRKVGQRGKRARQLLMLEGLSVNTSRKSEYCLNLETVVSFSMYLKPSHSIYCFPLGGANCRCWI